MTLVSPRLTLREPEAADAQALCDYYARNAARFAPWEPPRSDQVEEHAAWIAAHHGAGDAFLAFADDALAAIVTLDSFSREEPATASIAYTVDGAFEGQGYASEAVEAVVQHAFDALGLTEINAYYHPDNARSERLLRRLGFVEVARVATIPGLEGLLRPHVIARRTRGPFDARR
jgi:ribosomal-protein-alanine N-acetyltransferase